MKEINNAQKYLDEEVKKTEEIINLTELLYDKDENKLKYSEEDELKIEGFKNLKEIKIDTVRENYIEFAKVSKITIANCPNLAKVDINTFIDNKELEIINCPNLTYLDCSYNKLEKLDLNNLADNEKNNKLEILDCNSNEQLKELDIGNCLQLKTLNCNNSKLTGLDTRKCSKLIHIYCQNNQLNKVDLSEDRSSSLKILDLSKNNLSDFSFLKKELRLDSLKTLYLDRNEFNKSSLKDLKTKTPNLKELGIVETGISLDLRELPSDLEKIYCDNKKIQKELELCKKSDNEGEEYYDYQTWKKLINAQTWLDEHYPKDGEVVYNRKEGRNKKGKTKTIKLSINNKWLKGDLKLEQFSDLEKLDCSNNYLTDLDLRDCKNLTHLILSNNQFNNIDFLNALSNKKGLRVLKISNNEKLPIQTLDFLREFTGLEELNIEDCPFRGSLSPLKNMKNLKKIYISHTNIEEGLEDLPESCKELYCDFRYQGKRRTIRIAKELGKHLEEGEIRYYDLDKWRREKKDGVALVIPLDKLPTSKNSIKKFLDNWNGEAKELKDPDDLKRKGKMFGGIETGLKVPSIIGGILSLSNYSTIGGVLSVTSPAAEFIVEKWREKEYEKDKQKWDDFVQGSENIWDAYHELEETFKFIKPSSSTGEVSIALANLKKEIDGFLLKKPEETENNQDTRITKDNFPQHLKSTLVKNPDKLKNFEKAIESLQEKVSDYRHVFFGERDIKDQQWEQIKAFKDKLESLLKNLEDIEKISDEDNKLKEIIDRIGKEKIREEVEKLQKKLETKDVLVNDDQQHGIKSNSKGKEENDQQLDNQAETSNANNKGKVKETNEYEAQQLQEVKVLNNYGSISSSKN